MNNKVVVNLGGSIKNKITNPDLLEERNKVTFDRDECMTFMMGDDWISDFADFQQDIKDHPELCPDFSYYDMTREEKIEQWWIRYNRLSAINKERYFGESQKNERHGLWSLLYVGPSPTSVHFSMFFKTIEFLGSEQQAAELIPHIKKMRIIGCYAQTELGHGSNVAGLETTATLD